MGNQLRQEAHANWLQDKRQKHVVNTWNRAAEKEALVQNRQVKRTMKEHGITCIEGTFKLQ